MSIKDNQLKQANLSAKEEKIQNRILGVIHSFEELIKALQTTPVGSDDKIFIEKMKMTNNNFKLDYKTWMQLSNRKIPE